MNLTPKSLRKRGSPPDCHPDRKHKGKGLCSSCYDRQRARNWYRLNRHRYYGLSIERYESILEDQKNKCAICGTGLVATDNKLAVAHIDHDHATKEIRGLLCRHCNLLLGHAKDSVEILKRAVVYLEKYDAIKEAVSSNSQFS